MRWVYGTPEEMLSETFPCPAAEEGPSLAPVLPLKPAHDLVTCWGHGGIGPEPSNPLGSSAMG